MTTETWIVYKTENRNDYGWEERMLMPRESLTNILWENWTYQEKPTIPKIGDRTRNYKSESENCFTHHGRDGDWVSFQLSVISYQLSVRKKVKNFLHQLFPPNP
ncbi:MULTISPECIES: hypothetical protein [Okeania]|uniref:Uncharacterized protein n=1 Tax=Okeania hirsuta TaxID=1458930 RepID=A0A3N6P9R1_9CYAN|nr:MULTISPECIES: hypothetical protein [Okeania]NES92688.1 hypothetical protein [Okeania sp. SIO2B9]RQH42231.1 hypothetical protein D5R40_14875 [Okeania hirsuta]